MNLFRRATRTQRKEQALAVAYDRRTEEQQQQVALYGPTPDEWDLLAWRLNYEVEAVTAFHRAGRRWDQVDGQPIALWWLASVEVVVIPRARRKKAISQ